MNPIAISPYRSPCKGCQKRTVEPNCHSTCPEYLAFRQKVDADVPKKYAKNDLTGYQVNQIERQRTHQKTHTWKHYRNRMN